MPLTRRTVLFSTAAFASTAMLAPLAAYAGNTRVYAHRGIAVDGTDVVAYFTQGKPVAGKKDITHDWNGVTWRFSSIEHRDLFAADPVRYAPQYGGFCAYAVSEGSTASTVPEAWRIVDGKLYLNYSRRFHRIWERDIPGRIASGDKNWPRLKN